MTALTQEKQRAIIMSELANNFKDPEELLVTEDSDRCVPAMFGHIALVQSIDTQESSSDNDDEEPDEKANEVVLSSDSVKDYLKKMGREPLLSKIEEVELSQAIEVGQLARERYDRLVVESTTAKVDLGELRELDRIGTKAKVRMIKANLRLVVSIAKRYTNNGLPFIDLIQEGNLGLMHAVDMFDYKRGVKFSTYATIWIKQYLHRSIADKGRIIRISIGTQNKIYEIQKKYQDMLLQYGREPTDQEVADDLNISLTKLRQYTAYVDELHSLNMPIGEDKSAEYGDLIVDETDVSPEYTADILGFNQRMQSLLSKLDTREAFVIRGRFGLETGQVTTLREIGEQLGISLELVRRIEKQALDTLRGNPEVVEELRQYLSL